MSNLKVGTFLFNFLFMSLRDLKVLHLEYSATLLTFVADLAVFRLITINYKCVFPIKCALSAKKCSY